MRYFEQARQFLPNSSRIPESLAYVERRRGQWDRSESYFNEAERLDPRNVSLLLEHANSYIFLRRFPEALRKLNQILDITIGRRRYSRLQGGYCTGRGRPAACRGPARPLHPAPTTSTRWKHNFTKRSWSAALHNSSLG